MISPAGQDIEVPTWVVTPMPAPAPPLSLCHVPRAEGEGAEGGGRSRRGGRGRGGGGGAAGESLTVTVTNESADDYVQRVNKAVAAGAAAAGGTQPQPPAQQAAPLPVPLGSGAATPVPAVAQPGVYTAAQVAAGGQQGLCLYCGEGYHTMKNVGTALQWRVLLLLFFVGLLMLQGALAAALHVSPWECTALLV